MWRMNSNTSPRDGAWPGGAPADSGAAHARPERKRGHSVSPLDMAVELRDRDLMRTVSEAVKHQNCLLAYQPVVEARPPHRTVFHEGLIRVLDPAGRPIPARDFMDAAETAELGREIDCAALALGLRALERTPGLRLSLNMSARSAGYRRWTQILDRALRRDASLAARLTLEMSEPSLAVVPDLVGDFMHRIAGYGIAFALDEFGAGPTMFCTLRDSLFDAVKIDSQFVRDIHLQPDNQSLVQALTATARAFDMGVMAVGVESKEEALYLAQAGIDLLQGYGFGAPTIRPPWDSPGGEDRA
tara:strand:+ start:2107 stop:3009 length:903 start_codon:yes stop_codon:yes gene_type:complete